MTFGTFMSFFFYLLLLGSGGSGDAVVGGSGGSGGGGSERNGDGGCGGGGFNSFRFICHGDCVDHLVLQSFVRVVSPSPHCMDPGAAATIALTSSYTHTHTHSYSISEKEHFKSSIYQMNVMTLKFKNITVQIVHMINYIIQNYLFVQR